MSEKKTAYVVTSGSYSDYMIHGVYLDRETAEKACELYRGGMNDDAGIEEYEIGKIPYAPPGKLPWYVRFSKEGDVARADRSSAENFEPSFHYAEYDESLSFSVWARDKEHAIKIASEKRREALAIGIENLIPKRTPKSVVREVRLTREDVGDVSDEHRDAEIAKIQARRASD